MLNSLYLKQGQDEIIKPLGFKGSIYKQMVHFLPKSEGIRSMVPCLGQSCYICELYSSLEASPGILEVLKSHFKERGTHFNIKATPIFHLPIFHLNRRNNTWDFKVLKLFDSQLESFINFLDVENLYEIGSPSNPETLIVKQEDRWNLSFSRAINVPFIVGDPLSLNQFYQAFLNYLASLQEIDTMEIRTINSYLYNLVQKVLQSY